MGDYAQGMFGIRVPIFRQALVAATLRLDPVAWFFLTAGGVVLLAGTLKPTAQARQAAALQFLASAPVLSILVYRNAWPYYIAGVLVTSLSWIATVPGRLLRARPRLGRAAVLLGMLGTCLYSGLQSYSWYLGMSPRLLGEQRRLIAAAKSLFPQPVPYIDRCGMVASFPKVNSFITTLTVRRYRAAGVPRFDEILRTTQPPLLLANVNALDLNREWRSGVHALLREDFAVLGANFIQHWGPIWVAGKELSLEAERDLPFDILIAGTYTLEAEQQVLIDGRAVPPGQTLELTQGAHAARASQPGVARLRYGDHLQLPPGKPPSRVLFEDFRSGRPVKLF